LSPRVFLERGKERHILFPFAGELQDALADGFAEGLVGGDGVESAVAELRLALVSQEVNQTQRLTPCAQTPDSAEERLEPPRKVQKRTQNKNELRCQFLCDSFTDERQFVASEFVQGGEEGWERDFSTICQFCSEPVPQNLGKCF
jgi:hypothetical protein